MKLPRTEPGIAVVPSEKAPLSCAPDAMQVHSEMGRPKPSNDVPRSGTLTDPARLAMQMEREEAPVSSKPGSRPVESDGEPVSLRDIEMILAPGIAPPPLPTLAKAPSKLPAPRAVAESPAAEAPKAPRWTAEAAPLRRRKERPAGPATPDAAFQGLRLTPTPQEPKTGEDAPKNGTSKSSAPPAAHAAAEPHRALPVPHPKAPVIVEPADGIDVSLDNDVESAPPSGLLDVRTMMAVLDEDKHKSSHFDDEVLNLTGGIMGVGTTSPLLSPLPPPIDEGPRADEEEVLSLPTPGTTPKKLLAPVIPLGAEPEEPVEPSFPLGDPEALAREKPAAKSATAKKAAPAKAAAVAAKSAEATPQPTAERSKLPWIIAAGAVAVAAWMVLRPAPTAPPAPTTPQAPVAAAQAPTPPPAVETAAPPTTPAPPIAAVEPAAPAASAKEAEPPVATKPGTPKPEAAKPEAAKPEAAKPEAAKPEAAKPEAAPEPPPPQPAASGPEFDKAAANAALSSAAGAASGCRAPDDPQGTARVSVKFAPSGRVTSALVSGPPFAGTPTGSCIAKAFRGISVPPFSGDPVTVSKSINIR